MGLPTIETSRLILRPFNLSDAKDVQLLAGDIAIADTTLNLPYPYENGMAENWISKHQNIFENKKGVIFAITDKKDGKLIGAISLTDLSEGHQAELGYWIGKPYWNKGYCTEAAKAVLDYGFSVMGLIRIHATHFTRNPASGKVMKKLGMDYEGLRKKHVKKWDKFEDITLYGILKEKWETQQKIKSIIKP